ncbi:GNAT family N-acetyltransferase [Paludicola sp. MB14-C6]|uniref:GNAT family N-acetyltransferase n=1 Tax=Paludihabitans sp. MB14-C6 TaxID=3070656 RepID=UPI0027DDC553|nr:GNAT family N-acetyltransferase [Paludicola sp. MB14-C6]WMJ22617.1 GNAT family N-acetyltransferase [Paludicola sp. MB14-C6]
MFLQEVNETNRAQVNELIQQQWYSTKMVIRGKIFDLTMLDGYVVYEEKKIVGLITYQRIDNECEILSLDSLKEKQGIGTRLVDSVLQKAKHERCKKVKLITTNDNLNAMRFYQKRGFDMVRIYPNAVSYARILKPSIPLLGDYEIPIKHEIEFEINL